MKNYCNLALVTAISISCTFSNLVLADEDKGSWYLRPILGLSMLSDTSGESFRLGETRLDEAQGIDVSTDSGFVAGLGIGYQYTNNISAEIAWEYRTNDSSVKVSDGQSFAAGDYASNTFLLNGIYNFDSNGKWHPYIGAGITWVQEIDIDLQDSAQELSFSADGDVGAQIFGGLDYRFSENLSLQTEIRLGSLSGLNFEAENSAVGRITNIDYQTTTLQMGLKYQFR